MIQMKTKERRKYRVICKEKQRKREKKKQEKYSFTMIFSLLARIRKFHRERYYNSVLCVPYMGAGVEL
jgi:hypothetical protein